MSVESIQQEPVPQICGTCDKHQDGWCLFWSCDTDSTATCKHWKIKDEE